MKIELWFSCKSLLVIVLYPWYVLTNSIRLFSSYLFCFWGLKLIIMFFSSYCPDKKRKGNFSVICYSRVMDLIKNDYPMPKMFLILFSARLMLRTNVLFFLKETVIEVLNHTAVVLVNCTFSHCMQLWFLCTALPLIMFYNSLEFDYIPSTSSKVMDRTRNKEVIKGNNSVMS